MARIIDGIKSEIVLSDQGEIGISFEELGKDVVLNLGPRSLETFEAGLSIAIASMPEEGRRQFVDALYNGDIITENIPDEQLTDEYITEDLNRGDDR